MKNKKFVLLISLFLFFSTFFAVNYMLLPFDGYYWDVVLSKLKPVFTPEEGVVTNIIDGKTLEIELKKPIKKIVKVSLIGANLSLFDEEEKNESLNFTKNYIEGRTVALSYDWQGKDENGIIPTYLWVPVIKPGKQYYVLWNMVVIMNGYATLSEQFFRIDYVAIFQDLYLMAMVNKLGLLKNWNSEKPVGWDEIPIEFQTTLKNAFFREIEKSESQKKSDEWNFLKAFTGEDVRGKEYRLAIDSDTWRIDWKMLPFTPKSTTAFTQSGPVSIPIPQASSFLIELKDDTGWSYVVAFVSSAVSGGSFINGSEIVSRRGNITITVNGPNPYLITISKKNPNF